MSSRIRYNPSSRREMTRGEKFGLTGLAALAAVAVVGVLAGIVIDRLLDFDEALDPGGEWDPDGEWGAGNWDEVRTRWS